MDKRYAIVRPIGKGAQAKVYLAWDLKLELWRAVKVLAPQFLHDGPVRARFDGEAQMMARLAHRNLMPVVDVDTAGAVPYLVMDLARGGSVIDWMKRNGAMPPQMALGVVIGCCHGLEYAHAQGIVHRDVKPHNVLIHEDGRSILTDFGIARAEDAAQLTANGAAMGTFAFMPPEQRADAHSVTESAEVYALASTLFTMLTARTSTELFLADSRDRLLDGVPEVVRPIILQACKYEAELRYGSMAELRQALEAARERLPPDPPSAPLFEERIELAPSMPIWVDPTGLEDLLRTLTPVDELATTLYTEPPPRTGRTNPGEAPLARPKTNPGRTDPGERPSTGRTNPGRASDEPGLVIPYQMPDRRSRPAPPPGAPLPDYLDQPSDPAVPRGLVDPPAPLPAVAGPPAEPKPAPWNPRWLAGGVVGVLLLALILGTVGYSSVTTKSVATAQREQARQALVAEVEEVQTVVESLGQAGADVVTLREAWFRFHDADRRGRPEAALAFAALAVQQADQLGPQQGTSPDIVSLSTRLRDVREADERWSVTRASLLGRLTGSLGAR